MIAVITSIKMQESDFVCTKSSVYWAFIKDQ